MTDTSCCKIHVDYALKWGLGLTLTCFCVDFDFDFDVRACIDFRVLLRFFYFTENRFLLICSLVWLPVIVRFSPQFDVNLPH